MMKTVRSQNMNIAITAKAYVLNTLDFGCNFTWSEMSYIPAYATLGHLEPRTQAIYRHCIT